MSGKNKPLALGGEVTVESSQSAITDMVKAAAFMSDKDAKAHIKHQASLIFDENNPSLSAAEFKLRELQARHDELIAVLKRKRQERSEMQPFIAEKLNTDNEVQNEK